jgi:hypothetical protein
MTTGGAQGPHFSSTRLIRARGELAPVPRPIGARRGLPGPPPPSRSGTATQRARSALSPERGEEGERRELLRLFYRLTAELEEKERRRDELRAARRTGAD